MADTPVVADLAAHAKRIASAHSRLREVMAQLAAENANPVPLAPEPASAP